MPLYEYACDSCDTRFERIQKLSDPPVAACPSCGGPVRKLISSPAIQFKGTGWYVTDYARSGGSDKTPEKASEKTTSDSDSKSGASSNSGTSDSASKSSSSGTAESTSTSKPATTPGSSTSTTGK